MGNPRLTNLEVTNTIIDMWIKMSDDQKALYKQMVLNPENHLKMHVESVHQVQGIVHSCDECDYKTKWKGALKIHKDTAHGDRWIHCDKCDFKAIQKGDLKRHVQAVHEDNYDYLCDQCDYKAKQKRYSMNHK